MFVFYKSVRVIQYVKRSFDPSSMPHTAATNKGAAAIAYTTGADPGGAGGPAPPLTTKNEAPAPKFYKNEAPEWQF